MNMVRVNILVLTCCLILGISYGDNIISYGHGAYHRIRHNHINWENSGESTSSGFGLRTTRHGPPVCKAWCTVTFYNGLYLENRYDCCKFREKPGSCPSMGICSWPLPYVLTTIYQCFSDFHCPRGYKCCEDSCFLHRVCHPLVPESQLAVTSTEKSNSETAHVSTTDTIVTTTIQNNADGESTILTTELYTTTVDDFGVTTVQPATTTAVESRVTTVQPATTTADYVSTNVYVKGESTTSTLASTIIIDETTLSNTATTVNTNEPNQQTITNFDSTTLASTTETATSTPTTETEFTKTTIHDVEVSTTTSPVATTVTTKAETVKSTNPITTTENPTTSGARTTSAIDEEGSGSGDDDDAEVPRPKEERSIQFWDPSYDDNDDEELEADYVDASVVTS